MPATTTSEILTVVSPAAVEAKAEILTIEDVIAAKAKESGINPKTALKVAYCESTLRQFNDEGKVLRGMHNPDDVGLFQINEQYHLERSRELGYDIHTTEGNTGYALWLMKNEGIRHWKWSEPCWGAKI